MLASALSVGSPAGAKTVLPLEISDLRTEPGRFEWTSFKPKTQEIQLVFWHGPAADTSTDRIVARLVGTASLDPLIVTSFPARDREAFARALPLSQMLIESPGMCP
jgi:hypothetical protein